MPVAHVARAMGISRQCAHRWVARFAEEGDAGLVDRSSRPDRMPQRTSPEIEAAIAPWCEREGVGILVHSPLAKGALTGRYKPGHVFPEDDERARFPRFQGETYARIAAATERLRREVAEPRGLSLVQLAVGWTLRLPAVSVCLVGAKGPEQVREHVGAQGWSLSPEELERIDAIMQGLE